VAVFFEVLQEFRTDFGGFHMPYLIAKHESLGKRIDSAFSRNPSEFESD
jgi:hypothetical protein